MAVSARPEDDAGVAGKVAIIDGGVTLQAPARHSLSH